MKILIVDDHPLIRKGLLEAFKAIDESIVFAEASNGFEAIEFYKALIPDVILLDIEMANKNGISVLREIRQTDTDVKIFVVSVYQDFEFIQLAKKSGANGYFSKTTFAEVIASNILTSISNNISFLIDPSYVSHYNDEDKSQFNMIFKSITSLTNSELQVLKLIIAGNNNKSISDLISITQKSVENYINRISAKFDIPDTVRVTDWIRSNQKIIEYIIGC